MVKSSMSDSEWTKEEERKFKLEIKEFFDRKLGSALKKVRNPLKVGNEIGDILEKSDKKVVKIVAPRAVKK